MRQQLETIQGLIVVNRNIIGPAMALIIAVFGANTRVIQTRRNRVGLDNLAVFVLQQIRLGAVQHPDSTCHQGRGVFSAGDAAAARLDAHNLHSVIVYKRVENADGVRASADTGQHVIRQTTKLFERLATGFRSQ